MPLKCHGYTKRRLKSLHASLLRSNPAWLPKEQACFPSSGHKVQSTCFEARSQNCEKRLLASSCLSACLLLCPSVCLYAWNDSGPTRRIPATFDIWVFFENMSKKFSFSLTLILLTWRIWWSPNNASRWQMRFNWAFQWLISDQNKGYFTWWTEYIHNNIWLNLLRMRNVSDKVVQKIEIHFTFSNYLFLRKSYCLWQNVEKYSTAELALGGNIIRRMRISCWIPKATNTHSDYVILHYFPTPAIVARKGPNITL